MSCAIDEWIKPRDPVCLGRRAFIVPDRDRAQRDSPARIMFLKPALEHRELVVVWAVDLKTPVIVAHSTSDVRCLAYVDFQNVAAALTGDEVHARGRRYSGEIAGP